MAKKLKDQEQESDIKGRLTRLIEELQKYDDMEYSPEREDELERIQDKLVSYGRAAVPQLIEILKRHKWQSSYHAAEALGRIGDERAIVPLADALEEPDLGEKAEEALKKFGPVCVPEVIKRIRYRIEHPIKLKVGTDLVTAYALRTLGEIRCEASVKFLCELLDDYMSEMPDEAFDPTEYDWKYRNVDFFHLLDCMVRQQDKRAIPHIRKARDFFPEEYTEYLVCQIAIGRIKKGRVEGYLPMEALEIAFPSGAIMKALSGGAFGWEDTFEEDYGEYLRDDDEDEDEDKVGEE